MAPIRPPDSTAPLTTDLAGGASWRQRLFGSGSYARLAETHASIVAADAFFAVSLAGSLFFSVSVDAARPRVILYLALTMAPFAVVTPVIGPVIDRVRGGQRLVILVTAVGRGLVCLAMAAELRTLLFYPLAFSVLVLGKTYSVAKNALVPRVVADADTLVWANARLSRTASISGAVGSAIAAALLALASAPWVLRGAGGLYLLAAGCALRLPRPARPAQAARAVVRAELRAAGPRLAASTMGLLRAVEGFLLFLLAFALKQSGAPTWLFGAVFAASGVGSFAGTFIAPRVRRVVREEALLAGATTATATAALLATFGPGRLAMVFVALMLGTATSVGRRAFDSLVQRDAPDVERGRLFARFETRFQLSWVVGALIAVAVRPPLWAGFLLITAMAGFGAGSYTLGLQNKTRRPFHDGDTLIHGRVDALLETARRAATDGRLAQAVVLAAAAADMAAVENGTGGDSPAVSLLADVERLRGAAVRGRAVTRSDADRAIDSASRVVAFVRDSGD